MACQHIDKIVRADLAFFFHLTYEPNQLSATSVKHSLQTYLVHSVRFPHTIENNSTVYSEIRNFRNVVYVSSGERGNHF